MFRLYALLPSEKASLVACGQVKLSGALRKGRFVDNSSPSTYPPIPWSARLALIELSFADESELNPYRLEVLDAHGDDFDLPMELLDKARVRVLSDAQILRIAYRQLQDDMRPYGGRVWEEIERRPEHLRQQEFGPYLLRAFDEYTKRRLSRTQRSTTGDALIRNPKVSNG